MHVSIGVKQILISLAQVLMVVAASIAPLHAVSPPPPGHPAISCGTKIDQAFLDRVTTRGTKGEYKITLSSADPITQNQCSLSVGVRFLNVANVIFDCSGHSLVSDAPFSANTAGLKLSHTSEATIQNCKIFNYTVGIIAVEESNKNIFTDNQFQDNLIGIRLSNSVRNSIMRNIFRNNTQTGVRLDDGTTSNLHMNDFYGNGQGIRALIFADFGYCDHGKGNFFSPEVPSAEQLAAHCHPATLPWMEDSDNDGLKKSQRQLH